MVERKRVTGANSSYDMHVTLTEVEFARDQTRRTQRVVSSQPQHT